METVLRTAAGGDHRAQVFLIRVTGLQMEENRLPLDAKAKWTAIETASQLDRASRFQEQLRLSQEYWQAHPDRYWEVGTLP